jgi:adenylate kinase
LTHRGILLDGHFVLRNSQGALTSLETKVFKELRLTGVILLTDEASVIATRLAMRDKGETDVHAIAELVEAESAHALAVCGELGLPITVIHAPTEKSVTDAIVALAFGRNVLEVKLASLIAYGHAQSISNVC